MRTIALGAMTVMVLALGTAAADAPAAQSQPVSLNINAPSMVKALIAFTQQTGLQLIYPVDGTTDIPAPRLSGSFTPRAALEKLLKDSGLQYEFINERTVSITPKADVAPRKITAVDTAPTSLVATPETASETAAGEPPEMNLDEVVVTGTHIRGVAPAGSPLKVYSRQDIDRSGAVALDQFARHMTENFSSMDTITNSDAKKSIFLFSGNAFGESAFNLRGTGPGATLTLLNGRRVAPAGLGGEAVDMSLIPLSVVDHIEVLPDGASATYGTDAMAGVVNIVTRKDFAGAQTSGAFSSTSDGGADRITASQLFGDGWSSGHAMLNIEYDRQQGLDASERDYLPEQSGPFLLLPESRRRSAIVSAEQNIGLQAKLSIDALYSDRSSENRSAKSGDFFSFVGQGTARAEQRGLVIAFERAVARNWRASLVGNYSKLEQSNRSVTDLGFGTSATEQSADSDVTEGSLLADGPLMMLPAGVAKAALGVSFAEQNFEDFTTPFFNGSEFPGSGSPPLKRHVRSAHAEFFVPLVGEGNARRWAQRLELSLAARFDDYSDFGSSVNPKAGLAWQPALGVTVRGSYGTSFRAPLLSQLGLTRLASNHPFFTDPMTGLSANVLQLEGGNPQLEAEEASSFTAGVDVNPAGLPEVSLAATYFHIRYRERIGAPQFIGTNPLERPEAAPFVFRNPSQPDLQAVLQDPDIRFFPFAGLDPLEAEIILDLRLTNLSRTEQSGVDLTMAYDLPTARRGHFTFSLSASRLFENDYEIEPGFPLVVLLNDFGQVPKTKANGAVSWDRGPWASALTLHHVNRYKNSLDPMRDRIGSWTTADWNFAYRAGEAVPAALLRGATIALNVSNLTNEKPPFVSIPPSQPNEAVLPFDPANASPLGRTFSFSLSKRW